eukprot:1338987-Amorphochlora_amoeboformis.AAC.1
MLQMIEANMILFTDLPYNSAFKGGFDDKQKAIQEQLTRRVREIRSEKCDLMEIQAIPRRSRRQDLPEVGRTMEISES